MTAIRYDLHFAVLALTALAYGSMQSFILGFAFLLFGLIGVLHATTIVASLREHQLDDIWKAVFFIALAAVWSLVTFFVGFVAGGVSGNLIPGLKPAYDSLVLIFIFLLASAIGSSGYWLMVRLFWLKSLRFADWLRTVALCVAATFSVCMVMGGLQFDLDKFKTDLPWTVAWWFAFSLSLYWSETKKAAHKTLQSAESAS